MLLHVVFFVYINIIFYESSLIVFSTCVTISDGVKTFFRPRLWGLETETVGSPETELRPKQ